MVLKLISTAFFAFFALQFSARADVRSDRLEDRSGKPTMSRDRLELVGSFELPVDHITVSRSGRFFVDQNVFDTNEKMKTAEIVNGKMVAFPAPEHQKNFVMIHGLYVDGRDRLWILDNGMYAIQRSSRLFAFDINSGEKLEEYIFPSNIVGKGSLINDLIVDEKTQKIYITETSPIAHTPALVVYDIASRTSRRLLEGHASVKAAKYSVYVGTEKFEVKLGGKIAVNTPRPAVDGLTLDATGDWLYYAPFNAGVLYRVPTWALNDGSIGKRALEALVETHADITMTDGIMMDEQGRIYLTDVEHSAIVRLNVDKKLETLFKDKDISWPAGFARAADGWIYVNSTKTHRVVMRSPKQVREAGPFLVHRFKP